MKIRLSKPYMNQMAARIRSVGISAKGFDWDQLAGNESAQHWYETFKEACEEISKYRELTDDHKGFEDMLNVLKSGMSTGRLRWTDIVEFGC